MPVYCFTCRKLFSSQSAINGHYKNVHNIKVNRYIEYTCPKKYSCLTCNVFFNFNRDLRAHLAEKHNYFSELYELEFESFAEFEAWLMEEEKLHNVRYCKIKGKKRTNYKEKYYYECVRSHRNYKRNNEGKRALKSQGSCKMPFSCTSQVVVTKDIVSNKCCVSYYKTHYGHGEEIEHLRLSKLDRQAVASKLILGVSPNRIVSNIRDNIGENLERLDLITKEDVKNIKNSYGIVSTEGCKHKDDATSVNLWVSECFQSESSPVLFYKQQGTVMENFQEKDFCLVFMNPVQKDILSKFGSNLIAIDGTHGLNSYNFELTTILVKDEFGNGFPFAFMFSNRKDTFIYEIFFLKIKEIIGEIKTKVFMTDITNTFYNVWVKVMTSAEKRLFCAWHVDRAWQTNLGKITDGEKKLYTYTMLKELQYMLDPNKFIQSLNSFLEKLLRDNDTHNFGLYFFQNYSNNSPEWAYCYRKGCGVNTNMNIESFHKVLKYFYLDGKKVKCLDKSIHKILDYLRDKTIERIIKLKKGKSVESNITSRHRAALTSNFSICQCENDVYKLEGYNETYIIEKGTIASCCNIKCNFCHICIHSYKCTCIDYLIRTTICKHVHYFALQNTVSSEYHEDSGVATSTTDVEVKQLVSKIASKQDEDTLRNQIKEKALSIFQLADSKNINEAQIKIIIDHLNSAMSVSSIPLSNFIIENPSLTKEAGNKKIIKQQSFFSTKNKRKKSSHNLSKSSSEEKSMVKEMLNSELAVICDTENDHKYL